eukprot:RCo049800
MASSSASMVLGPSGEPVFVKPLTVMGDRITDDSSSKTVHVANLDPKTTEQDLIALFSSCGPIGFVRILGGEDPAALSRYAFVEFLDVGPCHSAFHLNGATLHGRQIKVNKSHNGLVKPHVQADTATQSRLKAVMARLNRKVLAEEAQAQPEAPKSSRRSSRSRSRSRS